MYLYNLKKKSSQTDDNFAVKNVKQKIIFIVWAEILEQFRLSHYVLDLIQIDRPFCYLFLSSH